MELVSMIVGEAANVLADGRFNILGGGSDRINAPQFPTIAQVALILRIEVMPTEEGEHGVTIDIINADGGKIIPSFNGRFNVPPGPVQRRFVNVIFNLGFTIPRAGKYSFEIKINGRGVRSWPFESVLISPPTA